MFGRGFVMLACAALVSELSLGVAAAAPPQTAGVQSIAVQASAPQVRAASRKPSVSVTPLTSQTAQISVRPMLSGSKTWRFTVQQGRTVTKTVKKNKRRYKVQVTVWSSVLTAKTAHSTQSRVVALDKGKYRIYVPAQNRYSKTITPGFSFPMALPAPTPTATPTPTPTPTSPSAPNPGTPTPTTPAPGTTTPSGGTSASGNGGATQTPGGGGSQAKPPTPPQALSAEAGNATITVSWFIPFYNGGSSITGYIVYANGQQQCAVAAPATSCVMNNLDNGTAYRITAVAQNAAGNSDPAAISETVVPSTVPSAPTAVSGVAERDGNTVVVSWSPGFNGGSAISGYRVDASPGGSFCETSATTCTFTGMATGVPYTFTVVATNGRGKSAASAPSSPVVPVAPPGTPYNVSAVKGAGRATVSWGVASNGSTIVKAVVVATPSTGTPITATVTGDPAPTSFVFPGLTNGTAYTFKVTATNALGWEGSTSAASPPVTPLSVPTPPSEVTVAKRLAGQVEISWRDSDNGGAPISRYDVYSSNADALVCRTILSGTMTQAPRTCLAIKLASGVAVKFRVKAYNTEGGSDWSPWSASVTPS